MSSIKFFACMCAVPLAVSLTVGGCTVVTVAATAVSVGATVVGAGVTVGSAAVGAAATVAKGTVNAAGSVLGKGEEKAQ
jgi:hypothetical protein